MSDELKPCPTPWCAHPRPTFECTRWGPWYVKCYGCDVRGPERATKKEAIAAWNYRSTEDENQRLREALEPMRKAADHHDAEMRRLGMGYYGGLSGEEWQPYRTEDDEPVCVIGAGYPITIGDLRRARAVLEETKE